MNELPCRVAGRTTRRSATGVPSGRQLDLAAEELVPVRHIGDFLGEGGVAQHDAGQPRGPRQLDHQTGVRATQLRDRVPADLDEPRLRGHLQPGRVHLDRVHARPVRHGQDPVHVAALFGEIEPDGIRQ